MYSIGTSHFVNRRLAILYYRVYRTDAAAAVDQLIKEGSIHIGKPPIEDGEILDIIPGEGRYRITRQDTENKGS